VGPRQRAPPPDTPESRARRFAPGSVGGKIDGMASATWAEVRGRRLARSSLVDPAGADRLVDVVRDVSGVHAQVQASAELQLALRVEGITQGDVREALWERRTLVKAWTLRGTLHLHPADELPLWHAARRATEHGPSGGAHGLDAWRDPAGRLHPALDAEDVKAIRAAVWEVLDGRCMLREEIAAEVVKRVGPKAGRRLRSGFAFFLADLCQGPPHGAKVTFARPDQWIGDWQELDEHDSLLETCRRYLSAYGPARPQDFCEWIRGRSFKPADARATFDTLGDELEEVDVEGRRAYVLTGDTAFPSTRARLRLLPEYDVYAMGSREREHLIPMAVREQVAAARGRRWEGPAGVRFVLVDGVAAGVWERRKRGRRIELRIAPTRRLTKALRAELDAELERLAEFTGLEPVDTVV
jgi:hypothetical protein